MDAWLNARLNDADPNSTMAPPHVMTTKTIEVVPEPAGLAMLVAGSGLLSLLARRRRGAVRGG
jgi:hypothetical protein